MNHATDQDPPPLSDTTHAMLALREHVFDRWLVMVRQQIGAARALSTPILVNTLPAFYDNIALTLTPGYPRKDATQANNAAESHGNERARMTHYRPAQLLHEYQLFRDAIAAVAAERGLLLDAEQRRRIELSIDAAQRDAIGEFSEMHEGLRRKLAATLSHDMLTPVATIVGGAQLIGLATELPAAKKTARKIADSGQRLGGMITQLLEALTVQGSEQLALELSQFDLRALVGKVCQEFEQQGVEIRIEGGSIEGYWAYRELQRAVENLVRNAAKYGDHAPVTIRLNSIRGRMTLAVHNTGNPIAADRFDYLFAYLYRENIVPAEGYGIGLPFVKAVAESHGGSVAVDSTAQSGTTFLIDLPIDCRPFVVDTIATAIADAGPSDDTPG